MLVNHNTEHSIKYSDEAVVTLQCIFEVQQEATAALGGQNTQGGRYKYAQLEDINKAIKPFLSKHNCIVLFGVESSHVNSEFFKLQSGRDATPRDKLVSSAYAAGHCTLVNIKNPKDWVRVSGYGFKVDQVSDKTLGAVTIMKRYLLSSLFNFDTGDDPDNDESDVRRFSSTSSTSNDVGSMLSQPTAQPAPAKNALSQFLS